MEKRKTKPSQIRPSLREQSLRFLVLMKRYAMPYWGSFIFLVLTSFLVTVATLAVSAFTAATLNALTGAEREAGPSTNPFSQILDLDLNQLGPWVIQLVGLDGVDDQFILVASLAGLAALSVVLRFAITYASELAGRWVGIRASRAIQFDLFKHMMGFSLSFFNRHRAGELLSRLEADAMGTVKNMELVLTRLITAPLILMAYIILTVRESKVLFFAVCAAAGVHIILTSLLNKPIQKFEKRGLTFLSDLKVMLVEALSSVRLVKSFGAESYEVKRLGGLQDNVKRNQIQNEIVSRAQGPLGSITNQAVQLTVLLFAAYEFTRGRIELDVALFFIYICTAMVAPIKDLSAIYIMYQRMLTCSEKVFGYFKEKTEVPDGTVPVDDFQENIEFRGVVYSYGEDNVLQNVDLVLPNGKVTALVGPSGSGKSTLVDLVFRFYDPVSGEILLDGKDLKTLKLADYRKLFGIVSQDSLLFNISIRDNITYGRKNLTDVDVQRAMEIANCTEFVNQLPQGLDTMVGDRGIRLSGGQRQRIAIARAVVANPRILILDEATSALDSQSENQVQQAIDKVTTNTTALVVAHRLSTVVHADRIVVMNQGKIVRQGNHTELMESCGLYQELVRLQLCTPEKK